MPRMDVRLAEGLVRKWQNIKSQALGSNHCFENLSEVSNSVIYFKVKGCQLSSCNCFAIHICFPIIAEINYSLEYN